MITNFVSRQVSREETRASQARRVTARDMENEEDRPRDIAASIQVIRATATTVLVLALALALALACSSSCSYTCSVSLSVSVLALVTDFLPNFEFF